MSYTERLIARQNELGRPIRVGLVGAGQMGLGFIAQVGRIAGMQIAAVADVVPGRAADALRKAGADPQTGSEIAELAQAIEAGGTVAVEDAALLTALPVDVVVDASGVPEVGAQVAFSGLLAGKDIALLNVECDVTIGYLLSSIAKQTGRIYSVCRGDEPAEAKRLVDFARDLAFEVVCAGKGKNNPLNPHATPQELTAEANSKHMNPKMLCSFVDGSKAMIEMAALANATGLEVSTRGMYGPPSSIEELSTTFRTTDDGGVLDRAGVVDYCTGDVAPGVFAIVRTQDDIVADEMTYLKMGPGPYFTLYRPYHLASIEAPLTIAEAVLDRKASLAPSHWNAEVVAGAKRDLKAGDTIDGIGGTTVYGVIESAQATKDQGLVPLGLLEGATMLRDVPADAVITADDVELRPGTTIAALRQLQDKLLAGVPLPIAIAGGAHVA
ncbi:oxidoreductase [Mycolicibacterium cosmeticum]|uniref:Dihydrodipicolinate reductase n=1 Tax=Mycolicibacterium cosmeticum TaxID=258533 RepID=W9AIW1_MYCCO|nr:SAF domain-containing protein [Mycolicibacterium cosmeticum]TLH72636.1 oxidoreductase [Mycolicibacterium cosmeticum]CDO05654.1 dihydrodipicolinate reductase [Mycolicibacterium cosmeticum]